jgi:diguanylate cyclase (GGDEF)-like protein/PAS domain S-box-containing protein
MGEGAKTGHPAEDSGSADLIWSVDQDFRLLSFNDAARRRFEINSCVEAAVGMSPEEVLPPEQAALWPPLYRRALRDGAFKLEYELPDHRILEVSFDPLVGDGETGSVNVRGRDITPQKLALEALQEAERKFRDIVEGAVAGIFQITPERKILSVNPALALMLGYDSAEDCLSRIADVVQDAWASSGEYEQLMETFRVQGAAKGFECRLKRKDGSIFWASITGRRVYDRDDRHLYTEGFVEDITDRRHAIEALEEREGRLRSVFEQNGSIMLMVEPDSGEIVDANHAAAAFYGYTQRQLIGMNIDRINALPAQAVAEERQRALREERAYFHFPHRLASGEMRDVEVYSSPVAVDGKPVLFSIVHDVTDRSRTEKLLRDSEAAFRATFEQAAIGIVHVSFEGVFLRSNARFAEILGYRVEEIPGMSVLQMTPPQGREESIRTIETIARNKSGTIHREKQYLRKDGTLTWVKISTSVERDSEGKPLHHISFVEQIDEQKAAAQRLDEAAEALKATEARYRTAFQTSLDAISISRLEDGKILDVNQAYLDVYGFERTAIVGRTSVDVHVWPDAESRREFVAAMSENSTCRDMEFQFRRNNGDKFWAQVSATRIELDGIPCVLCVLRDISEKKADAERMAATALALKASEERYRSVFHTCHDAFSIVRIEDGRFLDINPAFTEISGYRAEDIVGRTVFDVSAWADLEDRKQMQTELHETGHIKNLEARFRKKNGEIYWGRMSGTCIDVGGDLCNINMVRDISENRAIEAERAAAAAALRASEERYRTAFQTSLDAFTLSHLENGLYLDVNQAYLEMLGYEREEIIGRSSIELGMWKNPQDRLKLVRAMEKGVPCRDLEFELRRKNGQIFWVLISASPMDVDGVPALLAVIRDNSAAKAAAEEIKNLAFYDPLTHLPNRRLLLDRLQQSEALSIRNGRFSALLFVDLDNFKVVNDSLGHHCGDLLLIEVARRMVGCIRKSDTVGRLGGDEFVLILEELSPTAESAATQARLVAEKILAAIEEPFHLAGHPYTCTASIGISVFGNSHQAADEILRQADIAMYQAKSKGRSNLHFFAPALQIAVNARAALVEDLRQAIALHQFELYYQPQMDRTRIVACEALLRWNHPTRGLLSPDAFIPLAEETGQILALGNWVLEAGCEQLARWSKNRETEHLTIAINISALQFRQAGFVEQVVSELERSGADPRNLCLELTESTLLHSVDETIFKIAELRVRGVTFALDDFGTGYSSLSYLKRLPLDQLKIDRSFIRDILIEASSGAIVQTIVALGQAIGLAVIAEGVETTEQRDYLAHLGCYAFQGYLFSAPLPLREFEGLIPQLAESANHSPR